MANQNALETFEHNSIIRSDGDKRIYRAMKLNNGLKVVLVSDPDTDKASAALDVHVGKCLCSNLYRYIEHVMLRFLHVYCIQGYFGPV